MRDVDTCNYLIRSIERYIIITELVYAESWEDPDSSFKSFKDSFLFLKELALSNPDTLDSVEVKQLLWNQFTKIKRW